MKRKELESQIREIARSHGVSVGPHRQSKHEIWQCEGFTFPMPRHREINEITAKSILRRLRIHLENRRSQ